MASNLLNRNKDEAAQQALLAAITNLGTPLDKKPKKQRSKDSWTKVGEGRRSRFFYTPTTSFQEEVEHRKQIAEPKEIELVDQQVEERLKTYEEELPPKLDHNIIKVREFWLKEIAPLTLAAQSGSAQAQDVVQRTLNAPVDQMPFRKFQLMIEHATTIKMAQYIAKYLGIPTSKVRELLD